MRKKAFRSIFIASLITLVLSVSFVISIMYSSSSREFTDEIRTEAIYLSTVLDEPGVTTEVSSDVLGKIGKNTENRITLVAADGTVIYDNFAAASGMDNHLNRPEIADAVSNGSGEATRNSDTIGKETYYYAKRLDSGSVIRVASTKKNAIGLLGNALWTVIYLSAVTAALALVMSIFFANSITKPINSLNLSEPLSNDIYEELSPLLQKIEHQNRRIDAQIETLSKQREEFEYITSGMAEGIVTLSANGNVLTANSSAKKYLSDNVGGSYLDLCRKEEFINAVKDAYQGKTSDTRMDKDGRIYRLTVSPVKSDGRNNSVVVLIVDITDSEQAEKMRREFSANVSHELKTPLTSILGYAEIISNGVAKAEDVPQFAGKIHSEASRLLTLIEDIIKLSRLDEGDLENRFEEINLADECREVVSQLTQKAEKSGITLSFSGPDEKISGMKTVIHEMIYNLAENSVKYNHEGGFVRLELYKEGMNPVLRVYDNGIGIAPEHQTRIFERFYRVDKSHSKATGGTGLGLSIVKHGALLHKAKIRLDSRVGKGTSVCIIFPQYE